MIQPEEIQRNSDGMWAHSAWDAFCGEREWVPSDEVDEWIKEHGLEFAVIQLESESEDHPAYISYFENEDPDLEAWAPSPPSGDGWFLLSIHDTEDGPIQMWAREKPPATEGADG